MIALITGRLAAKTPGSVVVDVGGVGYRVHIPLSSFYELPDIGGPVSLHIHTHVREDAFLLYGFLTEQEKALFLALMGVSGVGPKLALNIISGLPFEVLVDAIVQGDEARVSTIPGIGKKTAARIVLELKDKAAAMGLERQKPGQPGPAEKIDRRKDEAVSALLNLGYNKGLAEDAVKMACGSVGPGADLEPIIREALKVLSKGMIK